MDFVNSKMSVPEQNNPVKTCTVNGNHLVKKQYFVALFSLAAVIRERVVFLTVYYMMLSAMYSMGCPVQHMTEWGLVAY